MVSERYEIGLRIRKEVLGEKYVENAIKSATEFDRELQDILNEYVWGIVWSGKAIPRKYKSLINIALLAAMGRSNELKLHIKGAFRNGCTLEEVKEALIQAMIYAGAPAGVEGFRVAREAIEEMRKEGFEIR
ncbi:MAG: 4-carboxymuconolactone decarboxylase [Desulfurococcaceae archaeon]|nr:MAG: 4-carboxymuconolactone decarboxylase [Desulfurococcaceae archaeon]